MRPRGCYLVPGIASTLLLLGACSNDKVNFSQYRGFDTYFDANPPSTKQPTPAEQALLRRFRPRLWLPEGHEGPVDFYRDYIASGVLLEPCGGVISEKVTPEILNDYARNPQVEFRHRGLSTEPRRVAYARIERATLGSAPGRGSFGHFTMLTYTFVFRRSGLPDGLPVWKALPIDLIADLDDWHQLDHYTAATVVLDESDRPVAMMLQQHNHQRTYLLGEHVQLPPDERVALDVAIRSNELYPHSPQRQRHRAVAFPGPEAMRFMLGAGPQPFFAASDVTDPAEEIDYVLEFLPADDAFYTFQGFLGERRWLPGRDGPPGAVYSTVPALKPWDRQLLAGYWRESNARDIEAFESTVARGDFFGFVAMQAAVFHANLQCLRAGRSDCQLR